MPLVVQKFGGTSVANAERVMAAARRAIRARQDGNQVVVVVSARGDTTDDLIEHPEFAFDRRGDRRQRFLLMPLPKNGQFARHRLEHTDFIGESGGQCHEDHAADAIFPEPPFERPMEEGFPPTDWSPGEK